MIELVLMFCLASEPDRCLDPRDLREEVGNPIACMVRAQTLAQEYLQTHRSLRLEGWRCEIDHPRENPA